MGNVTLSRLWIGDSVKMTKNLTVALWKQNQDGEPDGEPTLVNVDEDLFLEGLLHLFPGVLDTSKAES